MYERVTRCQLSSNMLVFVSCAILRVKHLTVLGQAIMCPFLLGVMRYTINYINFISNVNILQYNLSVNT